ncbi:MAG: GNAT family N-acetyltransferase [Ruegeria sp.]
MSKKPARRYALRPLEKEDLAHVSRWFLDLHDLAAFDRSSRAPQCSAANQKNWASVFENSSEEGTYWFAVESEEEKIVGMVGMQDVNLVNRDAVVALFVDHSVRRHGVGIRATALLLDLAFRQFGLNRITSYFREDNNRSADLMSRLGVQIEGRMRQAWYAEGKFFDMVVVGLLSSDWEKHRKSLMQELKPDTIVSFGGFIGNGWTWPPNISKEA